MALQAFARRLFRFLRRSLQLWPEQQPLTPVVHLWLAYIAPWCTPRLSQERLAPPHQTRRRGLLPIPAPRVVIFSPPAQRKSPPD